MRVEWRHGRNQPSGRNLGTQMKCGADQNERRTSQQQAQVGQAEMDSTGFKEYEPLTQNMKLIDANYGIVGHIVGRTLGVLARLENCDGGSANCIFSHFVGDRDSTDITNDVVCQ